MELMKEISSRTESLFSSSFPYPMLIVLISVVRDLSIRFKGKEVLSFLCKILFLNFYYSLLMHLFTIKVNLSYFFFYSFNRTDIFDILFSNISYATLISIYLLRSYNLFYILAKVVRIFACDYTFSLLFLFYILLIFFNRTSSFSWFKHCMTFFCPIRLLILCLKYWEQVGWKLLNLSTPFYMNRWLHYRG